MSSTFQLAKLNEIIEFKNGKAVKPSGGAIPIFGGNGILGYTSESNYQNTLILGRVGAYCGSVHISHGDCWVSDNAIAGLPKKNSLNLYNYYLLLSLNLNARQVGSSQPLLTQGILNDLTVKIEFDINKQKKITDVLLAIDKKIELNNRINAELEAMAKTLYDYWFVQFDFPDANGKPYKSSGGKMVYNPTLKRAIPEGWEVKKLADVTSLIRRGISPKYTDEGGISVLNQKCVRDQRISFDDSRRHQIELDDEDGRLLKPFDVLVNSTGVGTLGRVAYVKRLPEKKTTVDSHVSIVRAKPELLSPQYLAWKLMRHQPVIESAANGSTGQVELSKSFLEDIDVIIPSDSIVKSFEEFVTPLVPELAARETESEQLVQLRDWLLPMLMNGQVTVGEAS